MNLPAHIITCHTIHEPTRSWHSISRSKQSIIVSQNHTRIPRTTASPPGSAHTPPGETAPNRLAVLTSRQAPAFSQTPLFSRHRLAEHTVPPGATQCRPSHAKTFAWRLSVDRQAPFQKHSAAGFGTQFS